MGTQVSEGNVDEWVAIKEEKQDWVQELFHMLARKGIESRIEVAPGCGAGSCGCKFHLLVTKINVPTALTAIDEYFAILHPEIIESQEWAEQDKCPACGHDSGKDAKVCPDCGLKLIIEEV